MKAKIGDIIFYRNGKDMFGDKIVSVGTVGYLILKGYLNCEIGVSYTFIKDYKFKKSDFQTEEEYLKERSEITKIIAEAKANNLWVSK